MSRRMDDFLESFNCNRDFFLNFIIDKGWNMIWQRIVKFQDYESISRGLGKEHWFDDEIK